jgi:HEAT repeats/NACHT domain
MSPFDQVIEHMALEFAQTEGTSILFGVTDDTVLRDHALDALRKRLPAEITLREFRYDAEHLSLLEGAVEATTSGGGRPAVSVTGLEALPRDKRTEAIHLLNLQRNRIGRTEIAVILWVNRATLTEISTQAADFYSWRSATFLIEPPTGWNVLESMRRSYLQALIAHNEFVNLQGLAPMRSGQIIQMRMDDIFIPLRAEQQVKSSDSPEFLSLRDSASAKPRMIEEIDEVQQPANMLNEMRRTRAQWASEAMQEAEDTQEVTARPVDIPELLQENRAVVLGDPGAGKTTLLRYVAYELVKSQLANGQSEILNRIPDLAGCLPVYVHIGEYAQHLQQKPESTLDAFAFLGSQVRQLPLSNALVKDAMGQGRILFLLDGMDEIIDTIQRREVAQRIEEFAFSHPRCRILVTSRVVGYREAQLSREFSQFTISPFEDNEIHRFIQSWYKALGMPEGADKLVQAIEGSPSIRRLASNPLLLTVIALIHWRGDKLPRHRVRLYRLASETLVDEWMSHRRVTPEGWDVQETMQVLLPAIAWHLHQTSSTGLIGEQELDRLLVETLLRHDPSLSENEAHTRASQFRRNVSEFSGIFLERGLDQDDCGSYGFLHLTFEEYFAALRLADIWERAGNSVLKPLLDDPRWTESILLTAGHFGEFSQYQATRFVRMILEAHSEHEDVLHRDLLLAAQCLADDVRLDADLRRAILSQLIKIYFSSNSPRTLREDIRKVFARLSGTFAGVSLLKGLTQRLTIPKSEVCRLTAAAALGQMGQAAATPEVLAALLKLLSDPEEAVRRAAAAALEQMGQVVASLEALSALYRLLTDHDRNVHAVAEWALRKMSLYIGPQDRSEAMKLFLSLARSNNVEQRDIGYVGLRNLLAARHS